MRSNIWIHELTNNIPDSQISKYLNIFFRLFEKKWDDFLSDYDFENLCQLKNGNRLRALLVFEGYLLTKSEKNLFSGEEIEIDYIIDYSIAIEAIHKVSLLIDDLIDDDKTRHGEKNFHSCYGMENTIIVAMNLLLKAFRHLHITIKDDFFLQEKSLYLVINLAYEMSLGVIEELKLHGKKNIDVKKIKKIVELQTSSIIRDGLLLGYLAGSGSDNRISELIREISRSCGYIFQILNDVEPFGNKKGNITHKGKFYSDFERSKKNLVFSYIEIWASEEEKEQLLILEDAIKLYLETKKLINKYRIIEIILSEIESIELKINCRIETIEAITQNKKWCLYFKHFISVLISASKQRALN